MDHELARRFSFGPQEFTTSPLYGGLCLTAAADPAVLAMLAQRRPGVQPTNLLMAAVHHSLLQDPGHSLAQWFPSVCDGPARPAETAGDAFVRFCRDRREELLRTIRRRLVQTNVAKRAVALRVGLADVAAAVGEPITLIEVGASAGILLRFDEYGYRIDGRQWGSTGSPVLIDTRWHGPSRCPDLDALPAVRRRVGIDLHPIDARDPDERLWLRALIWPENGDQARLLSAALGVVAERPVEILAGDAGCRLPQLIESIEPGSPVVVFHAATLAHVPRSGRAAFTAAIEDIGRTHRLFHLSLEGFDHSESRWLRALDLDLIEISGTKRTQRRIGRMDGHGAWFEPA